MFELESFCHSLHGLTRSEVRARCEERASYFESLERSSRHGMRGQDPANVEYDYRGYVEDIRKLEHYIFGGESRAGLSVYEAGLFEEVEGHIRD
ncbi:MAG TPA: hypothetical protein VGB73_08275 [Pyrinomonadaceae bacterium]